MTRQRLPPVTHTDALFADQSQSILNNLVTSLGQNPARDWTQNAVIRNTSGFAKEETRSDNVRYPGFARVAAGIQALPVGMGRPGPAGLDSQATSPILPCPLLKPRIDLHCGRHPCH